MISQLEVSVESNSTEVKFMKIIFVRDDQHAGLLGMSQKMTHLLWPTTLVVYVELCPFVAVHDSNSPTGGIS